MIAFESIRNFLVLGGGTMGLRIGLQAALSGYDTVIYDIHEKAFDDARRTQASILRHLTRQSRITEEEAAAATDRISFTTDPFAAGKDADFVSESVPEDLELKRRVWRAFGTSCPAHAILTTNTSYLLPSSFAADTGAPERFCAFHFHDVFHANVVDIMPHPSTDPHVIGLLQRMGERLGQTPVTMERESPGYIFNAMLMAFIGSAGALLSNGIASAEDIDRSWMGNFKMDMGPFGILDTIGLDTAWHVTSNQSDARSRRFAEVLKGYVDEGRLGVKTGAGFYTYPNPAYAEKDFIKGKNG